MLRVRIPIRIDLRDYATWLDKRDPFSQDEGESTPTHWHKSLESFLSAHIRHHSGGMDFVVDDLHLIATHSPLLLVLDALDEVADSRARRDVVKEINASIIRLRANAMTLQVVITSRPFVYSGSATTPDSSFTRFELSSLSQKLVDEYATKWIRARKIASKDERQMRKILKDRMDQPHLKDLARNAMQLAILLSLIYIHGASLPDEQTSLYDNYVRVFFHREARKEPDCSGAQSTVDGYP